MQQIEVAVTTKHQAKTIVRDTGPYSRRNLAKGAAITDAAQVFAALRDGLTVEQVLRFRRPSSPLSLAPAGPMTGQLLTALQAFAVGRERRLLAYEFQ